MDDLILIMKMKQGDDDAIDRFVRKYYGEILRYCKRRCSDTGDAEDLIEVAAVERLPG